jgi:hypothetical protein
MKIIQFCKDKIAGIRAFIDVIKTNRLIAISIAIIIFGASTIASTFIEKAAEYLFPSLDDSAAIIENQNKQFDVVKENLRKLQNSISGADREYLNIAVDTIKDMKNESDGLALKLQALKDENKNLKQTLKSNKGVYGGVDVVLTNNSGFKIDSQNTVGFKEYGSGIGMAAVSLTSVNQNENVYEKPLSAGQGIYFTSEKNEKCSIVFTGNTKVTGSDSALGNFVITCKK